MNDLWQQFTLSGRVDDYLKYKENQQIEGLNINNENNNQGINYQRADDRRE